MSALAAVDAERSKAFWAKCRPCGHIWAAAYYPMPLAEIAKILMRSSCPYCGERKKIGIAKQEDGVLQEQRLPSGAAACAADSPAGSISSPISSGTEFQSQAKASKDNGGISAVGSAPMTGEASRASVGAGTDASNSLSAPSPTQPQDSDTAGAGATAPAVPFKSDGPKSRPGDAAASLTRSSKQPATGKTSAKERSSDRSGGEFGDAPNPATLSNSGGMVSGRIDHSIDPVSPPVHTYDGADDANAGGRHVNSQGANTVIAGAPVEAAPAHYRADAGLSITIKHEDIRS